MKNKEQNIIIISLVLCIGVVVGLAISSSNVFKETNKESENALNNNSISEDNNTTTKDDNTTEDNITNHDNTTKDDITSEDNITNYDNTTKDDITIEDNNTNIATNENHDVDTTQNIKIEETDNQVTVINAFEQINYNVNNSLINNSANVLDTIKTGFITFIDFIFYDTSINGITFNELNEENKQRILDLFNNMDEGIMNYFPNYKEEFSEFGSDTLNFFTDLIKKGAYNITEFTKNHIDPVHYNNFIQIKNNFLSTSKEILDTSWDYITDGLEISKDYIQNWYLDFRN